MSNSTPRAAETAAQQSPAPTTPSTLNPEEHYETAKGCFLLSLFILGALVLCAIVAYALRIYMETSVG